MNKPDASHRWFGHWRAVERPAQDDPADLGTAFGLDLSLSEAVDDGPGPPSPMDGQAGWMQRLTVRRKPAF